ncbi:MAG: hypothetical protein ABF504_04155, partial [Komagataeibacter saccharivorans]|uniref:hypothetical protein n=1 Tax=Komagataeibacter saccharivorans TaxID=265959 RepID=UPI0039E95993
FLLIGDSERQDLLIGEGREFAHLPIYAQTLTEPQQYYKLKIILSCNKQVKASEMIMLLDYSSCEKTS